MEQFIIDDKIEEENDSQKVKQIIFSMDIILSNYVKKINKKQKIKNFENPSGNKAIIKMAHVNTN